MRSCRRRWWVAAVGWIAAGTGACQTSYQGNENSPYYTVASGSRLTLNETLTIPPEQVAVFLQDGRVLPSNQLRMYYPHCKFEVRRRLPRAQTVTPDEFIVTRVTQSLMHTVHSGPVPRIAALGVRIGMDDDGPSVTTFATRLHLGSDRQPDVLWLTCGQWGYPHDGQHVTLSEIRRALGEVFGLELP